MGSFGRRSYLRTQWPPRPRGSTPRSPPSPEQRRKESDSEFPNSFLIVLSGGEARKRSDSLGRRKKCIQNLDPFQGDAFKRKVGFLCPPSLSPMSIIPMEAHSLFKSSSPTGLDWLHAWQAVAVVQCPFAVAAPPAAEAFHLNEDDDGKAETGVSSDT